MALPISIEDPIFIVVDQEGGWNAYSLRNEPTERDTYLFALLMQLGGINDTITPGTWQFNAAPLDETIIVVSLEPVPESQSLSRLFYKF